MKEMIIEPYCLSAGKDMIRQKEREKAQEGGESAIGLAHRGGGHDADLQGSRGSHGGGFVKR